AAVAINSSGVATFSTSSLSGSGSPHTITAVYGNEAGFVPSTSYPPLIVTINAANTTTTLTSLFNTTLLGQSVPFTARVASTSPGAVTGTVTFLDGVTTLGTGNVSGNTGFFTTAALSSGIHSLTAIYGGNGNFLGSTSALLMQTINKTGTTT